MIMSYEGENKHVAINWIGKTNLNLIYTSRLGVKSMNPRTHLFLNTLHSLNIDPSHLL